MITRLPPYPAYSDSGEPWLARVPDHWERRRLDTLFALRKEPPLDTDSRVTAYLSGRMTLRTNVLGQKIKGVTKETGWQRVHPGDFAISGMNAHLGGMGVSDSLGKCSPIYLVLQPRPSTNAHFVSLAVRHVAHTGALRSLVNTVRFNSADFKRDDLKLIHVWLPPPDEQAAIVRFLDHADRRIRRYIRAKQKLITLLEEQKQAIIHRAVTRGLDPDVRLKPSGVPWLGDVPEHWDIVPNRFLFREVNDRSADASDMALSMSQRRGLVPVETLRERTTQAASRKGYKRCSPGDLVLNRLKAHLGVFAAAEMRGSVSPDYSVFRPLRGARTAYYSLLFRHPAYLAAFTRAVRGVVEGFWRLYTPAFYSIASPFPPPDEQVRILACLEVESGRSDAVLSGLRQEISLIHAYRARLVADVVTGKLDVRDAAAALPDEVGEQEPLDGDVLPEDEVPEDAESEVLTEERVQ